MSYAKITPLLLLAAGVSSHSHLRIARRTATDDCPLMNLVEDTFTQTGRAFSGFVNELSNEDFAGEITSFLDEMNKESEGFFSGVFNMASGMFADFADAMENLDEESGDEGAPTMTHIVETISYHDGEADKTIETTKTYADGHSTHTIQNLPGPKLQQESSVDDIIMGYKDVIEHVTPMMFKLTEDKAEDVYSAFDDMYAKFEDKTKDMDKEEVLQAASLSKEGLIEDYEDFAESYEELDEDEDISQNKVISKKLDTLADNYAKLISAA
eukprot:CAMPEP_0172490880 /NCGR_PEP_ID=MMETSP1066-20121228/21472_1 /TAXON_ID=671091 /ORGANISM="Coscinodiscus wailesii, Strain CCMP2513" /LENGTH=268 /DNA_ID=CAMNT_0013259585 /DNA_START=91 /DNA_END=897 /DNA_ORIENTATION=-